jgi:YD repeat-containing protein
MGTTDSTGTWTTSSGWGGGYVGSYTQVWAVGGANASPNLIFNVVPTPPTPAAQTNPALGPSSSGALTWNQNGSLAQLAAMDGFNAANTATCAYTHDDLGRLGNVDCGSGKWQQGLSYDAFGNIRKTGSGQFLPGYDLATNHFNGGQVYDANGNLTYDGVPGVPGNTYAWDADGNLYQFTLYQGSSTPMVYDALGRRVEQPNGSGTLEILYGPDGSKLALMSGYVVVKAFAPLPGGATAVYNASGLAWYRHSDWLGSSRLASTPGGALYADNAYGPFGEDGGHAGASDPSFTGQNQDLTSILYDFPARG